MVSGLRTFKSRMIRGKQNPSFGIWSYYFVLIAFLFTARGSRIMNSIDFRINPIGGFLFLFSLIVLVIQDLNSCHRKSYWNYFLLMSIFFAWEVVHFVTDAFFDYVDMYSIAMFLTYSCFLVRRLGFQFFKIAENIIAKFSIVSVFMWILTLMISPENMVIFSFAEPAASTSIGSMILYNIPAEYNDNGTGILRNCGFAWEPGLFSCILCIGIAFNIIINKGRFNLNMFFLILGVLSSVSTTGYIASFVIFAYYYISSFRNIYKVLFLIVVIPISIYSYKNFDFIGTKIAETSEQDDFIINDMNKFGYMEGQAETYTPQRFECIQLQALNFMDSPIFGYGAPYNSFVYRRISPMISLSTGILTDFAKFGIILGLLFTLTYCYSFYYICVRARSPRLLLLIAYLIISVSYSFIMVPFTLCITMFAVYYIPPKKILLYKRMKQKRRRLLVGHTQNYE